MNVWTRLIVGLCMGLLAPALLVNPLMALFNPDNHARSTIYSSVGYCWLSGGILIPFVFQKDRDMGVRVMVLALVSIAFYTFWPTFV